MARIFLRFPGGRAKALTLSYDDGVEQDVRLIEIMNKHGLKGTFNLNSGIFAEEGTVYPKDNLIRRMTEKQIIETFKDSGHEIAVHSLTHPFLEKLPIDMAVREIIKDRENLENLFGTIIRGMAYPFGTLNNNVVDALRFCGIAYARTTVSTDDFKIPADWLRLPATCHHNSPELMNLAKKFAEDKMNRPNHSPLLFYLWGHSYEFEGKNNWHVIEDFASYISNRDDIWYATNIEIYDYIEAYNRLIFSVDGKRVKNPSNMEIWFEYSGDIMEVAGGADVQL